MLLIGSTAMAFRGFPRPHAPRDGDIDVICSPEEYERIATTGIPIPGTRAFRFGKSIVDPEIALPGNSAHDYIGANDIGPTFSLAYDGLADVLGRMKVASVQVLYSLKRSHRYRPKAWHKHMADYHILKSACSADVLGWITTKRQAETAKRKHISLKRTVTDFFDDDVSNQVFVHDHIHEAIAYRERPMFHYIRVSEELVTCDRNKWEALAHEDKVRGVLEEAYVIALERGIIPMLFQQKQPATARSAFDWALMRIGTTLTSGWFREFTVENYVAIMDAADMDYPNRFFAAVDAGRVQRISHSVRGT